MSTETSTEISTVIDTESGPAVKNGVAGTWHQGVADLQQKLKLQDEEAAAYALEFIGKLIGLRGVRVDRAHFLTVELRKAGVPEDVVARAVAERPAVAGIDAEVLDAIASRSIAFETRKSTLVAFAAGLPGGVALAATIPADLMQFYVHTLRIMQKLAYLYGWQSLIDDADEADDETLGQLAAMLGVMMGVAGAAEVVKKFAHHAMAPVGKNIAAKALTKTVWYPLLKSALAKVGVKVTKAGFAKAAVKVLPVAGGAVSGGLTFVGLTTQSKRLHAHLRELPLARAAA